jgi:hypothetical protein
MAVVRVSKSNSPYVLLHKDFLEDPNISLKLKGFLAYCLSKPNDWKFHVKHLISVLKEGKDAIYAIIEEGIENGYIQKFTQQRKNKGQFETVDYIIYESPQELKKSLPNPDFPDTGLPEPGLPEPANPQLLINDNRLNNEKSKEEGREESNQSPPPNFQIFSCNSVKMRMDRYESLVAKHGQKKIDEYVLKLNEYAEIKPKKFKEYGCHATVIATWIRRDEQASPFANQTKQAEKDKELAEAIEKKFPKKQEIVVGYNYIEFIMGPMNTTRIKFGDAGFKEQVMNNIRKLGLALRV